MKIIYSHLQKFIPQLKIDPKTVADNLSLFGHFADSVEKIDNQVVIDLEIRQNRADCLSYYGIAKELATLYQIPFVTPSVNLPPITKKDKLPIKVTAKSDVKRIMALRLSNLKNTPSPTWLKQFIQLHQLNSINTIVDLTNYIMFLYGIPNHAFDTAKSTNHLIWELNHQFDRFTTLDGTKLQLHPSLLMVNNPKKALSLSFLGGQACAINLDTTEVIFEMAVYNRSKVRADSHQLKTITEAGIRLDKELSHHLIPPAFSYLISLILKHCHGQITSQTYNYCLLKEKPIIINFDPKQISQYAGVSIPNDFALDTLKQLGCIVNKRHKTYQVKPPHFRRDLNLIEDLIEEIIRFWRYDKIPTDQPISDQPLPDITPPIANLTRSLKNILVSLGYDEVRSWPLIKESQIINPKTVIRTQNSINSKYPALRQSIIPSLINQKQQYHRLKLENPQFFEIGKIYYQEKVGDYQEKYSLALHHPNVTQLQTDIDTILSQLQLNSNQLVDIPLIQKHRQNIYVEIILDSLANIVDQKHLHQNNNFSAKKQKRTTAYELTGQITTLDANLNLKNKINPTTLIRKYSKKIGQHLWRIVITDIYHDTAKKLYRYTFRVSYFNLNSATAKTLHLKVFNLNNLK